MQCHRAVPDMAGAGADHRGIVRAIDGAVYDIGVDPRHVQPFDALTIDEHDRDDRRHLPHQPQYIETVPLVGAFPPRQLHGPLQLVGDVVKEALDLAGARTRLGTQPLAQRHPLIAIAEPRFARPVDQQRHYDRNKQRGEVFLK